MSARWTKYEGNMVSLLSQIVMCEFPHLLNIAKVVNHVSETIYLVCRLDLLYVIMRSSGRQ